METSLLALLHGNAEISALVGNRIYWDEIPQGTARPCIVMFVVSELQGYTFEGADPLTPMTVQIDCQATTSSAKRNTAKAVDVILSGYQGTFGDTTFSGIFRRGMRDTTYKPDSGTLIRTRQQDYEIWSKPTS